MLDAVGGPQGYSRTHQKTLAHIKPVTGEVVMVHRKHHWYRVRYTTPHGQVYHECFPEKQEPQTVPVERTFHVLRSGHAYTNPNRLQSLPAIE